MNNRKRPRDEDEVSETPEQIMIREKAEEQRLIDAQRAALESEFWMHAATEIHNVIASVYANEHIDTTNQAVDNNKVMNA